MKFTKEEVVELKELANEVLNSGRINELKISKSETPHLFARISNADNESEAVKEVLTAVLGLTGLSEEEIAEKTRPVSVDEILGATSELAKTGLSKLTGFLGGVTETVKEKTVEAKQRAEIRKELKAIDEEVAKILNQANEEFVEEEVEEDISAEENLEARQEALSTVFSGILESVADKIAEFKVAEEDKLTLEEFAKELEKDSEPKELDIHSDTFQDDLMNVIRYMEENDLDNFNGVTRLSKEQVEELLGTEPEAPIESEVESFIRDLEKGLETEEEVEEETLEDLVAKTKSIFKEKLDKLTAQTKELKSELETKFEDVKAQREFERAIEEDYEDEDECPCQTRCYESCVEESILLTEEEAEFLFTLIEDYKYTSDILFEILETRNPFSKYLNADPDTDHGALADLITLIERPDLIMVAE